MGTENRPVARLIARCVLVTAAIVLSPGAGGAQSAQPLVLQPGGAVQDVELNKVEITASRSGNGFVHLGAGVNKITLSASAYFCARTECVLDGAEWGRNTSSRRAQMYRDFCVPNSGADNCDSGRSSDPTQDLIATVSFDAQRIWQFVSFASGTASFKTHVEVIDLDDGNKKVAYQRLDDESQGSFLGKIKTIAKVPVPLPEFDGEQVVLPVVFTIRLRRGHQHRFILTMAAAADSGIRPFGHAETHMGGNLVGANPGGVEVQNLAITVAPAVDDRLTALEERVTALEEAVANHPEADEAQSASFDEKVNGLSGGVSDLTLDVESMKTAFQDTQVAVAGMQTRVGGLETQVGTLQIQFEGHTHDCVLLRPADGAKGGDRRGAKDDDHRGFGGQFSISCRAPKLPAARAGKK